MRCARLLRPIDHHASDGLFWRAVDGAIDGLTARDRECLQLAEWEQLPPDAAAIAMGCSTSAYKVRLHRARRRLAARLTAGAGDGGGTASPAQLKVKS